MLVIRKEQIDVFEKKITEEFYKRMINRLSNTYPEETSAISDESLLAMITSASVKAESSGIVEEEDVQRFLGCMVMHGPDFDRESAHPEVQEILADAGLNAEEKVELIELCFKRY